MLHVIAAMLSLLLLAGLFGNGLDATDENAIDPDRERGAIDEMAKARQSA